MVSKSASTLFRATNIRSLVHSFSAQKSAHGVIPGMQNHMEEFVRSAAIGGHGYLVDEQFRLIKEKVISELGKGNSNVRALITELTISDYMESIADHAKKICEDVVYTVDAVVIRHSSLVDTPLKSST